MKITTSTGIYLAVMALMLAVIVASLKMEYFGAKLLPLLISSIVFVLAGIKFRGEVLARDKREMPISADRTSGGEADKESWRGYLPNIAWTVSFLLGIYLLGFTIAVALFILGYMKWLGTRWRVATTFAVLVPSALYGLIEIGLRVELYRGLVLSWLGY